MKNTWVISLGGSLVAPTGGNISLPFLKKFTALILERVKKGDRFIVVVGGGGPARAWQHGARELGVKKDADLDWIGIRATQLNAELVRTLFGRYAETVVVGNPPAGPLRAPIRVVSGVTPGCSTDFRAVLWAHTLKTSVVINLSDTTYIYTKDPKKFKDALPLPALTWKQYLGIINTKWSPGGHVPFDPVASRHAQKNSIIVVFIGGKNLVHLNAFFHQKPFPGTKILLKLDKTRAVS